MATALDEARAAALSSEVPVGAVVVDGQGQVIGLGRNRNRERLDPTAHAEIEAIRAACKTLGQARLDGCDLYVTLEPCPMCAQAIAFAHIRKLVFAAYDPKGGGVEHGPRIFDQPTCHHHLEVVGGVAETEAQEILKSFFQARRD
ncbi:MAG: nucleoside deaminase [Alphaproteobacteria bacterium]|nr:nucleoside deaminase [Alphaproteobacteria bacterium]MBF0356215.1 nucleoside deaminase [Alphaproteobacteria bacterium]